ncbi:phage tail protein [Salmonella enterica subsp. enterica serovar Lille]|uniref:Phage tail protein n=1 Tax=Salmonella enterica subsp. enterica serovar Mbandaka TaxID=192954 RepID=A0A6Y5KW10_SALET|nr:phage tail protein [Salmonella enterica]EBI0467166.1 phage tail protein [Salmonella enterica subsp. enterica serovar Mbandaka]EBK6375218.1 phage tail protein [Salmonella enterica subsp. enterica serovar Stanley]EBN0621718.1 phage tail protein [Salmonella enterica subsp. enterica serovar Lille]ECG6397029.1 phage tail protein [Salmonella enterica subsp. enterica serovar Bredeney]EDT2026515.1 phage tail protein [Salmonella enterica subsp. enterica]EDW7340585.1 phage tail protein [Salmonella e
MSAKFYTLLTEIGAAKLASAAALGVPLKITHMAVGDGGGVLPTPSAQQTALVAEKRRAALNMLYIDPQNSSQIIAEQVIPETEGGWWIREVGLFDETGALIAVGNCPESYKPQLTEGSGRTQTVRMVLITSSTDNITLKIDPAVVLATRKYVDDKALELKVYVDDLMAKHLAAPDPHSQYAQKDSPTLTGIPKVPTPAAGNSTKQIANTEFVASSIAAIVDSAPAALDTLNELAAALGNDPNFATTMINALAGKQPLDNTLTNLSGKDIAGLLTYLGLGETINLAKNAVPATRRVNSKPLTGDITLSAADVNAFALGVTGDYTLENDKSVGWNWKSGVYNVPTGGASKLILHFNMNIGSCPAVQFCVNYKNGGISYRSARDDFGFELDWTEFYTTTRKPSAGDVGALPVSGGVINGNLGIGTPNILGGSSIVLGDNDTGLKQNGDGLLDIYANGVQVFRFQNDTLESKKSINVTGRLTPTDYGNFDSRYVQDFRLGSYESGQAWMGPGFSDTPGYVLTAATNGNGDELIDGLGRRPMQKLIGNQWYNVTSV